METACWSRHNWVSTNSLKSLDTNISNKADTKAVTIASGVSHIDFKFATTRKMRSYDNSFQYVGKLKFLSHTIENQ